MALSTELAGVKTASRILIYDLETAPLLAYVWGPKVRYVTMDLMVHDSFILTWSAKWLGEKEVHTGVLTGKEALKQNDKRIVKQLADLIREADVVVAHNGDRFDVPMLNNRLLSHGLNPLPPVRSIDTCALSKKNFRLAYNKLDYLGEFLGLGRKIKTDFSFWEQSYHGDEKALAKMLKYNKQDVLLLEKIFDRMVPYVRNLPRLVDATHKNEAVCPTCGSDKLQKRGIHRTNVSNFQRWQCQSCQRYSRSRMSDPVKLQNTPL